MPEMGNGSYHHHNSNTRYPVQDSGDIQLQYFQYARLLYLDHVKEDRTVGN
jgi:hypothetical protein